VERSVVLTGGWQTSKEGAYVEASRARSGTDWFIAREDLGLEGQDPRRITRLAQRMRSSRARTPSLAYGELSDPGGDLGFEPTLSRGPHPARLLRRSAWGFDR
jgi:hypothetical protein